MASCIFVGNTSQGMLRQHSYRRQPGQKQSSAGTPIDTVIVAGIGRPSKNKSNVRKRLSNKKKARPKSRDMAKKKNAKSPVKQRVISYTELKATEDYIPQQPGQGLNTYNTILNKRLLFIHAILGQSLTTMIVANR